ncbi:MAG: hypothetical protein AAGG11_10845 [Pseudomonadota bacterium]
MSASINKSIVLIHGQGPQPEAHALEQLWRDALLAGLRRDRPALAPALEAVDLQMAFYADAYPLERKEAYDAQLDLADLTNAFKNLAALDKPRRFRRREYDQLPGKSALKEFLADVGAPLARGVGLDRASLKRRLPESAAYWGAEASYAGAVQERLLALLAPLLEAKRSVLLIAHGFGAVIAYDCLWRLSHEARYQETGRLHTLLTLGSPLSDDSVRARLLGRREPHQQRYPGNLTFWHNVAAEDDAVCHDETVLNDFYAMLKAQRLSAIEDHLIYNLAVRYGRSDPHCSLGYLIHPRVATLLGDWLEG